jgi:hypothetical protein
MIHDFMRERDKNKKAHLYKGPVGLVHLHNTPVRVMFLQIASRIDVLPCLFLKF